MLSLPSTIAPAPARRATTVASRAGTESARILQPPVVRTPFVEEVEKWLAGGPVRLKPRVGPREPAGGRHPLHALESYFHGREHTTRMRDHGRRADDPPRFRRRPVAPDTERRARDHDSQSGAC